MSGSQILISREGTEGRVAVLSLNRPDQLNALSEGLLEELSEVLHDLEADASVRVIILRGTGRSFCAGYDLKALGRSSRSYAATDQSGHDLFAPRRTRLQQVTDIFLYYWNMAKVTISEVHGYCLAGGLELAMMSDLMTVAEDAQIGHPGIRGLGSPRNGALLPFAVGIRTAKEILYTGDTFSGIDAREMGLANHCWPADSLHARTVALADHIGHNTADHLAILKLGVNRFYENMGIYQSFRSNTDLDAAAHFSAGSYEFHERLRQDGLKSAVEWRDSRYRTDSYGRIPGRD